MFMDFTFKTKKFAVFYNFAKNNYNFYLFT